jgi:pectate lyase
MRDQGNRFQLRRLAAYSVFGFLSACSTDADPIAGAGGAGASGAAGATPTGGQSSGGASGSAGSGGSAGVPSTGGGAGTAGSATSGGQAGAGGLGAGAGGTAGGGAGGTGAGSGGMSGTGGSGDVAGMGGSAGTAGVSGAGAGSGGAGAGGAGSGGTGGSTDGDISITDPVPGFASVAGGTTGGGTNLASAVTVNSMSALADAARGSNPAIILVEPGNYSGTLALGANKTIIGTAPGVTINGNISISGSGAFNVIIRNLAVRGARCNSYDECRAGSDAVYTGNGAHHVWLDHLDIADGQDGNCDVTQGGDYVTISWSHFHYTYDKEHRFSNLIAGSDDEPNSVGKLRITYMNSHWGERVDSRQPRGRFGNVHMLNNYHDTGGSQIHGVGVDMALIAENSVYEENLSIWTDMGSPRGWRGIGNIGSGSDLNASRGSVFEIPYDYTAMPASEVVAAVTSPDCGAGNTCTLSR